MSIYIEDKNGKRRKFAGVGSEKDYIDDGIASEKMTWSSEKILDTLCPAFNVSGNPVTCNPVEDYPLSAVVSLEPKQAGSGDPSPENVRPISGYDSVKVNVRGKNLFNISKIENTDYITNNGDGSLTVSPDVDSSGVSAGKTLRELCEGIIPGTYTINAESTGSEKWVYSPKMGNWDYGTSKTLTDEMLDSFLYFYASGINTTATISNIQLELGSTPTPYESYQPGTTATLTLPETIYGGTVDAASGVESKTWGYIASYNGESLPGEWISDRDEYSAGTTPTTGAQVAYKLATPESFQASGNRPLSALPGTNTLYTDGNSLTVSGSTSPISAIESFKADVQASANQAEAVANILLGGA